MNPKDEVLRRLALIETGVRGEYAFQVALCLEITNGWCCSDENRDMKSNPMESVEPETMDPEKIDLQKIETLSQLIVRSRVFFDLWWIYAGADTRNQIIGAYRRWSEFFRFDEHAHFVSCVVHVSAIYETRRDTINLGTVVADCRSIVHSEKERAEIDGKYEDGKRIAAKVTILRNNLFAHRSLKVGFNEAFQKAGLKPEELRQATEFALGAVNVLRSTLGLPHSHFNDFSKAHLKAIMDPLTKTID